MLGVETAKETVVDVPTADEHPGPNARVAEEASTATCLVISAVNIGGGWFSSTAWLVVAPTFEFTVEAVTALEVKAKAVIWGGGDVPTRWDIAVVGDGGNEEVNVEMSVLLVETAGSVTGREKTILVPAHKKIKANMAGWVQG